MKFQGNLQRPLTRRRGRPMIEAKTMLAQFVQDKRKVLGLTQEELAERCSLTRGHIAMIEESRRSQLQSDTLLKLSRGLGVTVDELLNGGEQRMPGVPAPGKASQVTS